MIRTTKWKLNTELGVPQELYDMECDPCEFYNLINDKKYRKVIDLLLSRMERWLLE
jgi:hypothetical protein